MNETIKSVPPFNTGDKVITGSYACMNCNVDGDNSNTYSYTVSKDGIKLPECPKCGRTTWMKY